MNKCVTLPAWLDDIIFNEFGAEYNPQPEAVQYTPDNTDFDKIYLGTYFPRSYAEAYCIMERLLENRTYFEALVDECELNILDFCCGTGGEILGLIFILQERLPNLKRVNIDAFDANRAYVRKLFHIINRIKLKGIFKIDINLTPICLKIRIGSHLGTITSVSHKPSHIVLSFKALNELIQGNLFPKENIYQKISGLFLPLLADNGIMILSDLTNKNKGGFYYPVKMNEGINAILRTNGAYKSIFPYTCYHYEAQCGGCYMQDIIYVTHSHKTRDISKVAYRIMGKSDFAGRIVATIHPNICKAINSKADKNAPYNL